MQHPSRLRFNKRMLQLIDESCFAKQEHNDAVRDMRSNTREHIIVRGLDVPQSLFERYVQYVRDNTTEFTCHHKRFYWHSCTTCHRDKRQAEAYKHYHKARVLKVLQLQDINAAKRQS